MSAYPALTSDKLLPFKLILQRLRDDAEYLDKAGCPYGSDVIAWLKKNLGGGTAVPVVVEADEGELDLNDPESWADVAKKAMATYAKLEKLEDELGGGGGDVGDQINIIKSQAAMLERVISIRERALGHREIAEFRRVLLGVIEDLLDAGQRTELMRRLEG